MGAADISLKTAGYDVLPNLTAQGIYPFGDPRAGVRPFGASPTPAASSPQGLPSQVTAPSLQTFNYSKEAQSYPAYLRNLGEQMSQQAFQTKVNQGVRLGAGPQAYQQALNERNMSRLNYLGQAGQQQLNIEQLAAAEAQKRNQELLQQYASQISQRGQDVGYASSLLAAANRGGGGGGGESYTLGGRSGGSSAPTAMYGQDIFGNKTYGGKTYQPSQSLSEKLGYSMAGNSSDYNRPQSYYDEIYGGF